MVLNKVPRIYLRSQYAIGATMMLTPITHGIFSGWVTANLPALRSENSPVTMDDSQISWIISVQFIGKVISALPVSTLIDYYGCTLMLWCSLVFATISWVMLFLTNVIDQWWLLIVIQLLSGVWIGLVEILVQMHITDLLDPKLRGLFLPLYSVCYRIGSLYPAVISFIVPYKYLCFAYSIFLIVFILLLPMIPESPQYYLKRNNMVSAKESLKCVRHYKDELEIENELKELEVSVQQNKTEYNLKEFFLSKTNRKALFVVETVVFLQKYSNVQSVAMYFTFLSQHFQTISPLTVIIGINMIKILCGFLTSVLYNRIGSKTLIVIGSAGCSLSMLIAGLYYFIQENMSNEFKENIFNPSSYSWIPAVCIILHGISYTMGLSPVGVTTRNEYFPVNERCKCFGISLIVMSFSSFLQNKTFLFIVNNFGMYVNFFVYSLSAAILLWFSSVHLIQTCGKTLQEIQDKLYKNEEPKKTSIVI